MATLKHVVEKLCSALPDCQAYQTAALQTLCRLLLPDGSGRCTPWSRSSGTASSTLAWLSSGTRIRSGGHVWICRAWRLASPAWPTCLPGVCRCRCMAAYGIIPVTMSLDAYSVSEARLHSLLIVNLPSFSHHHHVWHGYPLLSPVWQLWLLDGGEIIGRRNSYTAPYSVCQYA